MMTLENGVQCSYMQNHFTPDCSRNYTVIGTKGRLENYGNSEVHVWTKRIDACNINGDIVYEFSKDEQQHDITIDIVIKEFFDYILFDKAPLISLDDAYKSVVSCIKSTESMRNKNKRYEIE